MFSPLQKLDTLADKHPYLYYGSAVLVGVFVAFGFIIVKGAFP